MANDKLIYASEARKAILNADPKLAYCIDSVPAVDAKEVVHGRWDDRTNPQWPAYDIRHCSVCVVGIFQKQNCEIRMRTGTTAPTAVQRWMVMGMAEKRLIDANVLRVHRGINVGANLGGLRAIVLEKDIRNAPTVDAVEVVYCKDCKCWEHMCDGMGDCTNAAFHLDGCPDPTMAFNDYCSRGERKDND